MNLCQQCFEIDIADHNGDATYAEKEKIADQLLKTLMESEEDYNDEIASEDSYGDDKDSRGSFGFEEPLLTSPTIWIQFHRCQ